MSVTITIPTWIIWAYLACGVATAAWMTLWEFPHGHPNPGAAIRTKRFWMRLPMVIVLTIAVWPYGIWDHARSRRTTRRAMARYARERKP